MSRTINRVELLGRVGADPEMRYSQSGTAVATLRLATDRRRQSGDTEPTGTPSSAGASRRRPSPST